MLNQIFKSIIEQNREPIVVCDIQSVIVYMNPAAISQYHRDLTGQSLKACHNEESNQKIDAVLCWFQKSKDNNLVFTYHDPKKNKDVYMVALRDDDGKLIGYYEKHEYRTCETANPYHFLEKNSGDRVDLKEKIRCLQTLCGDPVLRVSVFYDVLEQCGDLKTNYTEFMLTHPVDCDAELLRLPDADYELCCALLTMLLREDYFNNGSFVRRQRNGQIKPIVERMIFLLSSGGELK